MNSSLPHSSDPTGALSPFEMQKQTESTSSVSACVGSPSATDALKMRAPSRCTGMSRSWATLATAAVSSHVRTPPPQRLCVFSRHTSVVGGKWMLGPRTASSTSAGSSRPDASLGTVRITTPPRAEALPTSFQKMCDSLPRMISSPRFVQARTAMRLLIVPLGVKTAASLPVIRAAISSRRCTVGSSSHTSSPTSASYIARRISGVGWVTVSLRKSTTRTGRLRFVGCGAIVSDLPST